MKILVVLTLAILWQKFEKVDTVPRSASTRPKATVSGTIVSQTGAPLEEATITLKRHYDSVLEMLAEEGTLPVIVPARTDQQGRFSFTAIDAAAYDLRIQIRGYVEVSKELVMNPGQRIDDFNVQMIRAATISGQIRNNIGEPLVGTPVQLFRRTRAGAASVIGTKSSGDGSYQLTDFLPGEYFLLAGTSSGPNGEQLGSITRSIVASAGAIKLDISIDPKARQSLRGNLRVTDGSRLQESQIGWLLTVTETGGRMVRVPAPTVRYDSQTGDFVVSDLSPGFYRLGAQSAMPPSTVGMCGYAEALLSQADVNGLQITLQQCEKL